MADLNLPRLGAALFILGLVWAAILFFTFGDVASILAGVVASIGLALMAAFDQEDDSPPGPDDLDG